MLVLRLAEVQGDTSLVPIFQCSPAVGEVTRWWAGRAVEPGVVDAADAAGWTSPKRSAPEGGGHCRSVTCGRSGRIGHLAPRRCWWR